MTNTLIALILFVIGLILIIKGGDIFVDAASWMAAVSGIPKFIVGATIVSLATTLPELMVSVFAALDGKVDMAIGNAIGSVSANCGLILAFCVLCIPTVVSRKSFAVKGVLLVGVVGVMLLLSRDGGLSLTDSLILYAILILFLLENVRSGKSLAGNEARTPFVKKDLLPNLLKFVIGCAGIVVGSDLLVDYGSELARMAGISEKIISVTAIAIGTSLPELITGITSVRKKDISLSIGNIVGANIIDTALILPTCALVSGGVLPVSAGALRLDLPFCLAICAIVVLPTLFTQKLRRWQSVLCLAAYGTYLYLTCF